MASTAMTGSRFISRIPIPKALPVRPTNADGRKGYQVSTWASRQRQPAPHSPDRKRSAPKSTASKPYSVLPSKYVAKQGFKSKIPVLSKKQVDTGPPKSTTPVGGQPPTQPTPIPYPTPSSPPPKYTERPDASMGCYSRNIQSPRSLSSPSPPPYQGHTPKPEGRKVPKPSDEPLGDPLVSLFEGLDEDPELNDLSRGILQDIFAIVGLDPSMRAVALEAFTS